MKNVIIVTFITIVALMIFGVGAYFLLKPEPLLGSTDFYDTVTLQINENLFYDVRVPAEATLLSTDGATVYSYDLLTVGVQDMEPSSPYRVNVGGRWVFAYSADGWLNTSLSGFEEEQAYEGSFDTELTEWVDTIPQPVMMLDEALLRELRQGASHVFGGEEYITSQTAYGTFEMAVNRALTKMSTLYKQPISYGMLTNNVLWVTSNLHTVAVASINYNTCLLVTAYGEEGKQYAATLMGEFV